MHSSVSGYARFDAVRSRAAQTVPLYRFCRSCRSRRMYISHRSCGWKLVHRTPSNSHLSCISCIGSCDRGGLESCPSPPTVREVNAPYSGRTSRAHRPKCAVSAVRVIREIHTVVAQTEWFFCLSQSSPRKSRSMTCSRGALSSCPSRSFFSGE